MYILQYAPCWTRTRSRNFFPRKFYHHGTIAETSRRIWTTVGKIFQVLIHPSNKTMVDPVDFIHYHTFVLIENILRQWAKLVSEQSAIWKVSYAVKRRGVICHIGFTSATLPRTHLLQRRYQQMTSGRRWLYLIIRPETQEGTIISSTVKDDYTRPKKGYWLLYTRSSIRINAAAGSLSNTVNILVVRFFALYGNFLPISL